MRAKPRRQHDFCSFSNLSLCLVTTLNPPNAGYTKPARDFDMPSYQLRLSARAYDLQERLTAKQANVGNEDGNDDEGEEDQDDANAYAVADDDNAGEDNEDHEDESQEEEHEVAEKG